jgi:hypothetical protein
MFRGKLLFRMLSAGTMLCGLHAVAQQPFLSSAKSGAEGRLTVTATVVSSVGLVVGTDGEQRIIVANAVDPRDNVSRLQSVQMAQMAQAAGSSEHQKPTKEKKQAPQR